MAIIFFSKNSSPAMTSCAERTERAALIFESAVLNGLDVRIHGDLTGHERAQIIRASMLIPNENRAFEDLLDGPRKCRIL
jgi:hypothetical protein